MPDAELLNDYRKKRIDWPTYEPGFLALRMSGRVMYTGVMLLDAECKPSPDDWEPTP